MKGILWRNVSLKIAKMNSSTSTRVVPPPLSYDGLSPEETHRALATALRFLCLDAVEKAQSGHPGMPMGMADVATVLFSKFIRVNPQDPQWLGRDRFVLSAGHGSMLLYALHYLSGYEAISLDSLKTFRQLKSLTAGHPEYHPEAGIETTTGPLGQGLANAVGMALGQKRGAALYGEDLFSAFTYVIAGDGCLMEGLSQEAISFAGHHQLSNLILFFDDNHISIDGATELTTSEDTLARFKACQWDVQQIDGHDPVAIEDAIKKAQNEERPSLIACRTTIGFGAPRKAGTAGVHGSPLGPEEREATRQALNWPYPPFDVPDALLTQWRHAVQKRGQAAYQSWQTSLAALEPNKRETLQASFSRVWPETWQKSLNTLKEEFLTQRPALATRQSSGKTLDVLTAALPDLVGGSADLSGSNKTQPAALPLFSPANYGGRYIHYGVREHAMAAIMNGLALFGGCVPYGGTFLVFSDYCKPAIRLSALMKLQVIYVLTHDSIGLGEDGPTHQPIEHLASLRAIPDLLVFRPADAVETVECWEMALLSSSRPSVLALSRQNLPNVRQHHGHDSPLEKNLCAQGGYILTESPLDHQVTLIATGSEVSLALDTRDKLAEKGVGARVVSLPCWELFKEQSPSYQRNVLGSNVLRVSLEAASSFGWETFVGSEGLMFGLDTFGASAPYQDLYEHFGLTSDQVSKRILEKMGSS